MLITHIVKELYVEGEYRFRNLESTNWGYPVECPTAVLSAPAKVNRGDWLACSSMLDSDSLSELYQENINNDSKIVIYDIPYPNLTESERYEFGGLVYAISHLVEAWNVVTCGNHGTSTGADIKNKDASRAILKALKVPIERANLLLAKMREEQKSI